MPEQCGKHSRAWKTPIGEESSATQYHGNQFGKSDWVERFWNYVDKQGPNDCWPWLGSTFRNGYGLIKIDGKKVKAHRVSWLLHHKQAILPNVLCLHSCDEPNCVNPVHLSLGTAADNMSDRRAHGRLGKGISAPHNPARGERHGLHCHPERAARGEGHAKAKLTDADVRRIRAIYSSGARQVDLAEQFGIDQTTVSCIVRGSTWTHVK